MNKRFFGISLIILLIVSLILQSSPVKAQQTVNPVVLNREIDLSRAGITSPFGFTFDSSSNSFIVYSKVGSTDEIQFTQIKLFEKENGGEHKISTAGISMSNFTYDPVTQMAYTNDRIHKKLIQIRSAGSAGFTQKSLGAAEIGITEAMELAFDPITHELLILDAAKSQIVTIYPKQFSEPLVDYLPDRRSLSGINLRKVRGMTVHPVTGNVFLATSNPDKIIELSSAGAIKKNWDISFLKIDNLAGIAFSPTGDPTDDPENLALNILNSGVVSSSSAQSQAKIFEISLDVPAIEPLAATLPAAVVRSVQLSAWVPPSPDTAGIAFWSATGGLLISDSEVDELPALFTGKNIYSSTLSGTLQSTCSTTSFSYEPTGVAINDQNGHIFFSNDDSGRVYEVNLGHDGQYCTTDDTVTYFSTRAFNSYDPEGVAFGEGKLIIADGEGREVYIVSPGANGVFDGVSPTGDDLITNFDTYVYNMNDPEGIEYNPNRGTINIVGNYAVKAMLEMDFSGNLLTSFDLATLPTSVRSGLAYGPASDGSGARHFYLVSRGVDNGTDPNENDGMLYEINTFQSGPTATPSKTTSITYTATSSLTPSLTSTSTFTPTPSLTFTPTFTRTATNTFTPTTPPNTAPLVDAGINQAVILPGTAYLDGTVSDDGRPDPPNLVTTTWSMLSGPGVASFDNASAIDTIASFTQAGTYVLQLNAYDGALTSTDTVTIVVMSIGTKSIFEKRIVAGNDDAEETATGLVNRSSSTIELVYDTSLQTDGFYFSNINIPPGVTITSAYIQFKTAKKTSDVTSLVIKAQAAVNPVSFAATAYNISSRVRSTASASWTPPAWTIVGESGINQRTSDISAVVQETINRPGWTIGNSAVFIITGSGKRVARAYNSDAAGAALLHVEFQPPGNLATSTLTSTGTNTPTFTPTPTLTATSTSTATFTPTHTSTHTLTPTGTTTSTVTLPPTFTMTPTLTFTPSQTMTPTQTFTHTLTSTITETPTITLTHTLTPTITETSILTHTPTSTITETPTLTLTSTSTSTTTQTPTYTLTPTPTFTLTPTPILSINMPPSVSAGNDQTILLPANASLDGSVSDDGLPIPPGSMITTWSLVSGPGLVTFANSNQLITTAQFSAAGIYTLRLTAFDGEFSSEDEVTIKVGQVLTYEVRIVDNNDEAEEFANGWVYRTSTDLELVYDSSLQTVGLRFRSIPVPNGAVITNAYIQFTVDSASSEATSLNFKSQAADNPGAFTATTFNVSTRPVGSEVITWDPVPWLTVGTAGLGQQTPNLSSVVQEVVNRPGWMPGNSMVFIITGTGRRVATAYYGNAAKAPLLHIEYVSYQ